MIITICGKSGSGKSTLAKKIIDNNEKAMHIDIDKIGHDVLTLEDVKKELINILGIGICTGDFIDRKKLGKVVFNSPENMDKLTEITWKYMELEIDNVISLNRDKIIVLDWLLLIKTKYFQMSDIKVLIDIPYETRKERAIKRDNISSEDFDLREEASIDFNKADFDLVMNDIDDKILNRRLGNEKW